MERSGGKLHVSFLNEAWYVTLPTLESVTILRTGETNIFDRPDLSGINMFDTYQAGELFEAGDRKAMAVLRVKI